MKNLILVIITFTSMSVFANQDITLGPDGSVTVSCSATGTGSLSIGEKYAELPYSHKLNILKSVGIGSCRVEVLSGNFNFFYSDRYTNGINLNNNSRYLVNRALKNGDCGL